jgi:hypothetical protein
VTGKNFWRVHGVNVLDNEKLNMLGKYSVIIIGYSFEIG